MILLTNQSLRSVGLNEDTSELGAVTAEGLKPGMANLCKIDHISRCFNRF